MSSPSHHQPPLSPPPQQQPPLSPPTAIPIQNPSPPPPIIQALSYSPLKKPQPLPWSHEETLNLIKAYQEKWYSLKRGQLKASQWEEVAITVAARCGLDEPSKSGTQCRHKIEKLRKRFRAEKQKLPPSLNHHNHNNHYHYHNHPWIYYSLMDQLERGPLPISAIAPPHKNHSPDLTEDEDNVKNGVISREFLRNGSKLGDFGNGLRRGSDFEGGFSSLKKRNKGYWEGNEEDVEEEEEEEEEGEGEEEEEDGEEKGVNLVGELAVEMREFAERFVRIERKKMELMRDTARIRVEMESKKREMILVSQQKTLEMISKAFGGGDSSYYHHHHKKMKMTQDL